MGSRAKALAGLVFRSILGFCVCVSGLYNKFFLEDAFCSFEGGSIRLLFGRLFWKGNARFAKKHSFSKNRSIAQSDVHDILPASILSHPEA